MSTSVASEYLPVCSDFCCQWRVVTTVLILLLRSCYLVTTENTNGWVSLDKTRLTLEKGTMGQVTCSQRHGENGTVTWIDPLDRVISVDNRSRIYFDHDSGRLTLTRVNVTDSGTYVCAFNLTAGCRDDDYDGGGRRCNATLDCRVYAMPDYFVGGMVILAINGVLIVILVACYVHSTTSEKRRLRNYGLQKL